MADKQPNQAIGNDGAKGAPDGVNVTPGAGESGGGSRPGKQGHGDGDAAGLAGHGGQSEMGYHGPGQLGAEKVDDSNPNATAREG